MAAVERFEELMAWQAARGLAREIHVATGAGTWARDASLGDQANRAAAAIAGEIAAGFERGNRTEFHRHLSAAKGWCGELRSHLYIALDREHMNEFEFGRLKGLADDVNRHVGGLRTAVARQAEVQQVRRTTPDS
ncbi:MAG: four helix bundle protein [Dehalococcoidia bacterium]